MLFTVKIYSLSTKLLTYPSEVAPTESGKKPFPLLLSRREIKVYYNS
jgi:hypothetical protein